jgi:hypothetical protein
MKLKKKDTFDHVFELVFSLIWLIFSGLEMTRIILLFDKIKLENHLIQILISICFILAFICFMINLSVLIANVIIRNIFEEEKE